MTIISYSRTGNNMALAEKLAQQLNATHIPMTKPKSKSMFSLVIDMIFNKSPKVNPEPEEVFKNIQSKELVLFVGPVWMGKVSSPLRPFLDYLKKHPQKYGFISISGGAIQHGPDGANPNLKNELISKVGVPPDILINKYIATLLPQDPEPEVKDTINYKLTNKDIEKLTKEIISELKQSK